MSFIKKTKGALLDLQNSRNLFYESSRLDATILTRMISKGATNSKLKFFQVNSFLSLLEFLNPLRNLIKL
jgi:hypothetical protein